MSESSFQEIEGSILVNCDWLARHRNDPRLILLDASMPLPGTVASATVLTIAGARRFDIDSRFSDSSQALPHMMLNSEQFQINARGLGINNDSVIVVFDDRGIYSAPRAWWMLKAMGAANVMLLNGGLPAWQTFGGKTAEQFFEADQRGDFVAKPQGGYFCDVNDVRQALQQQSKAVIDARSADRFFGRVDEPRSGLRRGHMPGALNLAFDSLLNENTYRDTDSLRAALDPLAHNKQQLIFSCGSGVTACVVALAAKLAGFENACVYDGSWAEWGGRGDLPISDV